MRKTGKEAWRFNTIPGPGEPGHETWARRFVEDRRRLDLGDRLVRSRLEPDVLGHRQSGSRLERRRRGPATTCTRDSVVALDADTGKLKWHFQFTPHDEFDYDSMQVPVLADINWQGAPRKVMLWANRNGFFYVLDRATGEFLLGQAVREGELGRRASTRRAGRKRVPGKVPTTRGHARLSRAIRAGPTGTSPSFSPRTGLFYIPTWVNYVLDLRQAAGGVTSKASDSAAARRRRRCRRAARGPTINLTTEEEGYGAVRAFDPKTGEQKWEFKMTDVTDAGVLTTASDLVFSGGREGYFFALDARTGALLWKVSVGGAGRSPGR